MGQLCEDLAMSSGRRPLRAWVPQWLWPVALVMVTFSCDSSPDRTSPATSAPVAPASASAAATAGTSATTTEQAAAQQPFAGTWKASFTAKRALVTLPSSAPDSTWTKDSGEQASGDGSLELEVAPDGLVTGTASGALGKLTVRGMVEETSLRAGLTPADPAQDIAMTGVLVGQADGESITAELRVSNQDASLVRAATMRLDKQ